MPRRAASTKFGPCTEAELVQAAKRFNASGAIWPSAVLAPRSGRSVAEDDRLARLFEIHRRSCSAIDWHLNGAARRHESALKVVASFVGGVCNPQHEELAALGALWSLPDSRRRHVQAAFESVARRLATVLEQGRAAGSIRDCDCVVAAHLVLGLVLWTPVAAAQAPPRKLLNGRRLVEGLQDLLLYGRAGDRRWPLPANGRAAAPCNVVAGDHVGPDLRVVASRIVNRIGPEAVTTDSISSALRCSRSEAVDALRRLQPLLASCQRRAIEVVLQARDDAFTHERNSGVEFPEFMRRLAEAYLRDDVQPLSPLAVPLVRASAGVDPVRLRWQMTWELLRERRVDGVAKGQVRERFYDLSPIFAAATCAFLCSGLWSLDPRQIEHTAQEVAAIAWLGLSPNMSL